MMPVTLELWRIRRLTVFLSPQLRAVTRHTMVCCLTWLVNACRGVLARANRILDPFMPTVHTLDAPHLKSMSLKLRCARIIANLSTILTLPQISGDPLSGQVSQSSQWAVSEDVSGMRTSSHLFTAIQRGIQVAEYLRKLDYPQHNQHVLE